MSTDAITEQRANRLGVPCPPWCTSDHDMILVEKPVIYLDAHIATRSGPSW